MVLKLISWALADIVGIDVDLQTNYYHVPLNDIAKGGLWDIFKQAMSTYGAFVDV